MKLVTSSCNLRGFQNSLLFQQEGGLFDIRTTRKYVRLLLVRRFLLV